MCHAAVMKTKIYHIFKIESSNMSCDHWLRELQPDHRSLVGVLECPSDKFSCLPLCPPVFNLQMLSDVEFCRFEQNRMGEVDPLYSDIGVNETGTSIRMVNLKIFLFVIQMPRS